MADLTKPLHASTTLTECASTELRSVYNRLQSVFTITPEKLKHITTRFVNELRVGLTNDGGDVPMNPTWVTRLPTGNEKGSFLTMDMGGTNFRVCQVELLGEGGKYDITQVAQLKSFGCFTFSYPVTQTSIKSGILQRWTKGFDISGVDGRDMVAELQKILRQEGLPIQVAALINDTTGTLMASSYADPETQIGTIFGTGSNAASMERCSDIPKLPRDAVALSDFMAINCEYGAFDNGQHVLPFTEYDDQIDHDSPRPGQQRYERLVAGYYLGEIYRRVLVDTHDKHGAPFVHQDISRLRKPYNILDCSFLERLENDLSDDLTRCRAIFREQFSLSATTDELAFCRRLAQLIGQRAARLYACGIAAIMKKRSLGTCHVAVDGSVFNKYPQFHDRVMEALEDIFEWPRDARAWVLQ